MKKGMMIVDINRLKNIVYGRGYYAGRKRLANPLADEDIMNLVDPSISLIEFARRVEKAHNIKPKKVKAS